ncbi:cytochrome P450 4d8-like [Onthophagus taurus]|uniref:cytochrome P450 4d8-like n=1 Tax=Onthophagus taurus TaxID=166361 RepID=UPI0039BE177D
MDLFPLLLLFISILFISLVYYYWNYFWIKSKLKNVPFVHQIPIFGSMLVYKNTLDLYRNLVTYPKIYGKTYGVMCGPIPVIFTSDLNLLEMILSSPKHINKPSFYKIIKKLGGNGLIAANGETWKSQRKLLTPTFHFKILEKFLKIFNKHSEAFINDLKKETVKKESNLPPITAMWALNQLTETVMGLKSEENEANNRMYLEEGKKLLLIVTNRLINPLEYFDLTYYFTRNYWRAENAMNKLDNYILETIRKKNNEMGDSYEMVTIDGKKQKIVSLDLLMETSKQNFEMSEYVLKDQVHTLMFAGYDTTAATVAYALYNLAEHPEIQQKVYEEIRSVLDNDPTTEITLPLLQKMKYLEMFIKESMRRYTHVPIIGRELGEDVHWNGTTLPKGLVIVPALISIHMEPENYPNPEEFIPERFSPENIRERHPYSFIPFSAGPRNCIGQKYAMFAIKVVLAKLILKYQFVSVNHQLVLSAEIALISKTGVKIAIKERKDK